MEELTTLTSVTICKEDFASLLKLRKHDKSGIIEHIIQLTTSRSPEAKEMLEKDTPVFISKKIKNYDHLNNLELRSDIENGNIFDTFLFACGSVGNGEDETFAIDCKTAEGMVIDSFLYSSEFEYEEDLKILGLK